MDNNRRTIDFFEALALIFITLKLIGYIDWSWWQVLIPAFISTLGDICYYINVRLDKKKNDLDDIMKIIDKSKF